MWSYYEADMSTWKIIFVFAATSVMVPVAKPSQQSSTTTSQQTATCGSSQVHCIVLPGYPLEIPKGPNLETYRKNCLICHSSRYVSMQPRFSKTMWQSEVKKMVEAYGAPISEADQALIVEYLLAVKGVEAPVRTSA